MEDMSRTMSLPPATASDNDLEAPLLMPDEEGAATDGSVDGRATVHFEAGPSPARPLTGVIRNRASHRHPLVGIAHAADQMLDRQRKVETFGFMEGLNCACELSRFEPSPFTT